MTWLALIALGLLVAFVAEIGWPGLVLWVAMWPFLLMTFAPLMIEKENDHERKPE